MRPRYPAKVLVNGAAGFIGSHLVERLLRENHYVIGIDSFTYYYSRWMKRRNLANVLGHKRFMFIEADLLDLNLTALLRGELTGERQPSKLDTGQQSPVHCPVDCIFHLAAQPVVRASWGDNFQVYVRNNVLATQRLLESAKKVLLKRFVYAFYGFFCP